MEAQAIRTQRADDARQRIEAAIARRKDEFAVGHVVWTADYGYVVKFHLGPSMSCGLQLRSSCSRSLRAWTECSTGFA